MEAMKMFDRAIGSVVGGPWMLILLVGTGIILTFLLKFPQLRYFRMVWREIFFQSPKNSAESADKSISSFAATATAMAATVGTGNIAGVATALHLGGPGALFWMLVSAFFGMCTKFAEIVLAVEFRQKDEHGDWRGGTMYILEHGVPIKGLGKLLAVLFALFAFLASFGIGAAVQANSTAEGLQMGFNIDPLISGIVLAILVGLVIVGGLKSLSTVTTYLVPFMAIFYIVGSIIVLAIYAAEIPAALALAVRYAFKDPSEVMPAGVAGWAVMQAVNMGIARGVFSNEAGLGSAPMVHATANVDHSVRQGLYGIFEVFMDTIVICSMTALVIISTGALTGGEDLIAEGWTSSFTGARLSLFAFEMGLGTAGKYILSLGLALFAFTTILGWYWYAETAIVYLFGVRAKPVMKILHITMVLVGACGAPLLERIGGGEVGLEFLNLLWSIADKLNSLMAIPNLIGLLLLAGVLRKIVSDFDAKRGKGEIQI